jgi:hypothetical protein
MASSRERYHALYRDSQGESLKMQRASDFLLLSRLKETKKQNKFDWYPAPWLFFDWRSPFMRSKSTFTDTHKEVTRRDSFLSLPSMWILAGGSRVRWAEAFPPSSGMYTEELSFFSFPKGRPCSGRVHLRVHRYKSTSQHWEIQTNLSSAYLPLARE